MANEKCKWIPSRLSLDDVNVNLLEKTTEKSTVDRENYICCNMIMNYMTPWEAMRVENNACVS